MPMLGPNPSSSLQALAAEKASPPKDDRNREFYKDMLMVLAGQLARPGSTTSKIANSYFEEQVRQAAEQRAIEAQLEAERRAAEEQAKRDDRLHAQKVALTDKEIQAADARFDKKERLHLQEQTRREGREDARRAEEAKARKAAADMELLYEKAVREQQQGLIDEPLQTLEMYNAIARENGYSELDLSDFVAMPTLEDQARRQAEIAYEMEEKRRNALRESQNKALARLGEDVLRGFYPETPGFQQSFTPGIFGLAGRIVEQQPAQAGRIFTNDPSKAIEASAIQSFVEKHPELSTRRPEMVDEVRELYRRLSLGEDVSNLFAPTRTPVPLRSLVTDDTLLR